jgi:hypothetical protein
MEHIFGEITMKPLNTARMLFVALALTATASLILTSCSAPLRSALVMKQKGLSTTYPIPYDQAYTAMRTALRWSSDYGIVEDHKELGYVLLMSAISTRYGTTQHYDIIWLDAVGSTDTQVTLLTSGMTMGFDQMRVGQLQGYMDYAAKLTKEGKPLPIMP